MDKLKNILFLVLVVSYLALLTGFIGNREDSVTIQALKVNVRDSSLYQFIGSKEVLDMLADQAIQPIGKAVGQINLQGIEHSLVNNQIIREAEVYITEPGIL